MAIAVSDSQMADKDGHPLIGVAQTLVADVATTGATNTTPYGFTTAAQANALVAAVNSVLAILKAHGLMKAV
jgi:hypothetical protein